MSGMRRNPRRKGSERAESRPLKTNVLSSINKYMECVLSLSRSCLFWFFESVGSETDKEPTGQKFLVCFGTIHVDTEFQLLVSRLFLNSFSGSDCWSNCQFGGWKVDVRLPACPGQIRQVRHGQSVPWRTGRHSIRALSSRLLFALIKVFR